MKHFSLPVLICLLLASASQARLIRDPKPAMTWEELNRCRLVVVGHYTKHNGRNSLTLKIDRVLRSTRVKVGDELTISLQHWYSIETGAVGDNIIWAQKLNKPPDGVPKLCYREQLSNPGLDVPVKIMEDVHKPAIYFMKDESHPSLMVQNQVQPAFWADGWGKLLSGKKPGMLFRLSHKATLKEAVEKLKASRDPKLVKQYVEWLVEPPKFDWTRWRSTVPAEQVLKSLGDKDGDVYKPLIKRIRAGDWPGLYPPRSGFHTSFLPSVMIRVCARIAPDRTWNDCQRILNEQKGKIQTHWVAANMCFTGKTEAVDKAFALLEDPHMRRSAIWGIAGALSRWWPESDMPSKDKWRKLREHALPLVRKALASDNVIKQDKDVLQRTFDDLLKGTVSRSR